MIGRFSAELLAGRQFCSGQSEHFSCMLTSAFSYFYTAQHARKFLDSFVMLQGRDPGPGVITIAEFGNAKMLMALARDLRQMRHAKHLTAGRQAA